MDPESCFDIIAREPIDRGHGTTPKEKLRVAVTEAGVDREVTVFLKWTSLTEVVALRAANLLTAATAIPQLLQDGQDSRGHWIAIPFYAGRPARTETAMPENVPDTLAAMHAHYLGAGASEPLPVIDARWCQAMCELPLLRQRAVGRPVLQRIIDRVESWSAHPVLLDALANQPRTVLHGDVHRNNVLVTNGTGHLVDWEGARYGLPMLDLITLGGPASPLHERYSATWAALTGDDTASPDWRRGYLAATVCHKVRYLTFAARHFGDDHATRMLDDATHALTELERMVGA